MHPGFRFRVWLLTILKMTLIEGKPRGVERVVQEPMTTPAESATIRTHCWVSYAVSRCEFASFSLQFGRNGTPVCFCWGACPLFGAGPASDIRRCVPLSTSFSP